MTTGSACALAPVAVAAPAIVPVPIATPVQAAQKQRARRRRISPEAGRALEILGHAIEYLADEYAYRAESLSMHDGPVEAMQLLMRANRQIYFDCPEVPSLAERWPTLLRPRGPRLAGTPES